jgi:two-component system sensor histidine kinase KdpD
MALRFLADESEEELLEHLNRHQTTVVWETTERIMVAVTAAPGTEILLRRAARIAARVKGEMAVVHVVSGESAGANQRGKIEALRTLAADLDAHWYEIHADSPAGAIIAFAQQHQITQIIIGPSRRSRWQEITGGGSIVRRVLRQAGATGIDVHVIARRALPPSEENHDSTPDDGG